MQTSFHIQNRKRFTEKMNPGELALFFAGESMRKTADEAFPFFASRNFLYLTGIHQEKSILWIEKSNAEIQEYLYTLSVNKAQERWTGRRMPSNELTEISGVNNIESVEGFKAKLYAQLNSGLIHAIYFCIDRLPSQWMDSLEKHWVDQIKKDFPEVMIKNSYFDVTAQRRIKDAAEVDAMRKGIAITKEGIGAAMSICQRGIMEYEIEGAFKYTLAKNGLRDTAFPSIVAGGERIFYLHYPNPMKAIESDTLVLMDVGAAYDDYCTDISRVFPVSGKFSPRQAEVYRIAYEANRAIMKEMRPGQPFSLCNEICRKVCFEGLKDLGLLTDFSEIGRYVWHGVAHHVGLDTHDVGGYNQPMEVGNVFTVDAGIYIEEWQIGLRIEDNILITETGCENLSECIPAKLEDVEVWMAECQQKNKK